LNAGLKEKIKEFWQRIRLKLEWDEGEGLEELNLPHLLLPHLNIPPFITPAQSASNQVMRIRRHLSK